MNSNYFPRVLLPHLASAEFRAEGNLVLPITYFTVQTNLFPIGLSFKILQVLNNRLIVNTCFLLHTLDVSKRLLCCHYQTSPSLSYSSAILLFFMKSANTREFNPINLCLEFY